MNRRPGITSPMPSAATPSHPPAPAVARGPEPDLSLLRLTVFVYIGLWIFEGALRKWILPGLANPLLVVRDPVLLGLYALAMAKGVFPKSAFILWTAGLAVVATVVSVGTTNTPMTVTLYGIRSDFLHLPLIFLLPNILHRSDLRLIGKYVLALAVGMGALVVLQFTSGAGSFANRGAGEGTIMLDSAYGHIRPSGTFSYTNGLGEFISITAAFFLQHLLEKRLFPRLIWLAAAPALLTMIILSGSRGAMLGIGIIVGSVLLVCLVQRRYLGSSLKMIGLLWLLITLIGSVAVFQQGMNVFSKRFEKNGAEKRGLAGRYFDMYTQPFSLLETAEPGGAGLGMGTNVAAGLTVGHRKFLFAEGEGQRVILESGPVVGLAYLMLRLCLMIYVGAQAFRALREHAATLPVLLFSGCFNDLLIGQFAQATELGYVTITAGLCLAAARWAGEPVVEVDAADTVEEQTPVRRVPKGRALAIPVSPAPIVAAPLVVAPARSSARGRSAFAQQLHASKAGESQGEQP